MLESYLTAIIRILAAWAAGTYFVESFFSEPSGFGFLDIPAVMLSLWSVYTLAARKELQELERALSVLPFLLMMFHLANIFFKPDSFFNYFFLFMSGAGAVALFSVLRFVKAQDKEIKPEDEELGKYPIELGAGHFITTKLVTQHVGIMGSSGSGKSDSYFKNAKYQSIHQGKGSFNFDAKSEELSTLAYYAHHAGRSKDLVVVDFRYPEYSHKVNPLSIFRLDLAGNKIPDSTAVSNIVYNSLYFEENSNPFYSELGKAFIRHFTGLFHRVAPVITFADYFHVVSHELETVATIEYLCQRFPDTDDAAFFKGQWINRPIVERQKVISGLMNKLSSFITGPWAPLINTRTPTISVQDIMLENKIFHFGAASLMNPTNYRPISVAFIQAVMTEAGNRSQKNNLIPFDLFLDEFPRVAYPGFSEIVELIRSTGVSCHLGFQSLGDLEKVSDHFREAILDNTTTKIFFRILSDKTADRISKMLGTKKLDPIDVYSFKSNQGLLGGDQEAGFTRKTDQKGFAVEPDEIKRLMPGEAVVSVTYKQGVTYFKLQFDQAPKPPLDFTFQDRLPLLGHDKDAVEKSVPFGKEPGQEGGSTPKIKPIIPKAPTSTDPLASEARAFKKTIPSKAGTKEIAKNDKPADPKPTDNEYVAQE